MASNIFKKITDCIKYMPPTHEKWLEELWHSETDDYTKNVLENGWRMMQNKRDYKVYILEPKAEPKREEKARGDE